MPKKRDIYKELISNKSFRDWVLQPDQQSNEYWNKWIKAHEGYEEQISKARRLILNLSFQEEHLSDAELEDMLTRVISKDNLQIIPDGYERSKRRFSWRSIAAVILVLLAVSFLLKEYASPLLLKKENHELIYRTVANPAGKKSHIKLPDGSKVVLNSNSSLSFPRQFSDKKRIVSLTGEAFFDVREIASKPFVVRVGQIEIEVLGTSFNVNGFEENPTVNVALIEGKVLVRESFKPGKSLLAPGQKLTYNKSDGSFHEGSFDMVAEVGWKEGILYFKDASFEDFIERLELWYGVEIHVKNNVKKDWRVNGQFNNESLEEILMGVQFSYNITYKIEGKNVVLIVKD